MLRNKGLTGKFHFTRWGVVALALVLALGTIGVTYAGMKGPKGPKDDPIPTAYCSDPFTWVASNDNGTMEDQGGYYPIDLGDDGGGTNYDFWGPASSDDPSAPQAMGSSCARYDKDVAKTEAVKIDDYNIEVTVSNAYPSYHPTVFFALECPESVSGTIIDIVVDEIADDTSDPEPDIIPELTVTYSGIYSGQPIPSGGEVSGALHVHVNQSAEEGATYTIRLSINTVCADRTCGTAYAYGGPPEYTDPSYATCFIDMPPDMLKNPPWGWTNGALSSGATYTFPMYAGAAHCDISGGELVGTVTIDYYGSTAIVTYDMNPGYTMDVTHLYVGNEPLPTRNNGTYTVSPGQYPYTHVPADPTTDTYTISGLSGDIYVIAHAVSCWFE